ncbi:hypothetical protein EMCRGX_G001129 [Ephydatia muelleri]
MRFFVKKKGFQILNIPSLGARDVLVIPVKEQLVSGRPRHPQSQGLVERAHQTLHKKMAAEISASGMKTPPWSDWLPRIVFHDTTGASPYELVFGQKARTVIFPTQQNAIVLEEDLANEGIDVGISSEQATVISTSQHQAF